MPTHTTSASELVDLADDGLALLLGERTMRRRIAADDLDPGIALAQVERELDQGPLVAAAVEVEALAGGGRAGARSSHQLRPVDAVGQRVAEHVHRPDQRLSVRHVQVRAQERRPQCLILGGGHHRVDVADADVGRAPARRRCIDPVQRLLIVDQPQRDAQHVHRRRRPDRLDQLWQTDPGGARTARIFWKWSWSSRHSGISNGIREREVTELLETDTKVANSAKSGPKPPETGVSTLGPEPARRSTSKALS